MITIYDKETQQSLGQVTPEQFQILAEMLEEESRTDTDYYINRTTLGLLQDSGADPTLLALLDRGLAQREEMDIEWRREGSDAP
jgi:hypothetical protein